jgi:uncharacterized membrane protein
MRKTIAKAVTWRFIGTAEIFAISFWTTGHVATAGHTAGIAAVTSIFMYVIHELAWGDGHLAGSVIPRRGSRLFASEIDVDQLCCAQRLPQGPLEKLDNCPDATRSHSY